MDDGIKQRLIGAVVLVALGVIFVPSLLNREGRREVDLTTQVPPEPVVMPRPLEIPDPTPPANIPTPKPIDDNYSHQEQIAALEQDQTNASEVSDDESAPVTTSGLNEDGIPYAWSIQVSSFESEANANAFERQLQDAGFTAYIRSTEANGTAVHRVFVGPKINRQTALETKAEIDKRFNTQALLIEFKP